MPAGRQEAIPQLVEGLLRLLALPRNDTSMNVSTDPKKISLFKGKQIRKIFHRGEWWFSVVDVIEALTDSSQPSKYWTAMKARVSNEGGLQLSTICRQLKLESSDGKKYETDCADTEGIFRIIQSVPSPKAEPFKRWLAKVGYERVQEIENPELATKRTRRIDKTMKSSQPKYQRRRLELPRVNTRSSKVSSEKTCAITWTTLN